MEDDYINDDATVETSAADQSVWLMKCPPVVSKAWQSAANTSPVAKVIVSLDLLHPNVSDDSAKQHTLEMAGSDIANIPKSYTLNMSKEFFPMGIFSESNEADEMVAES